MKTLTLFITLFLASAGLVDAQTQSDPTKDTHPTIEQQMEAVKAEYAKTDSLLNQYTKAIEQLKNRELQLQGYYEGLSQALKTTEPTKPHDEKKK